MKDVHNILKFTGRHMGRREVDALCHVLSIKDGTEYVLEVHPETVVLNILSVKFHFGRIQYGAIVMFRIGLSRQNFLFIAKAKSCGSCDARTDGENYSILTGKLISKAGNIRTQDQ